MREEYNKLAVKRRFILLARRKILCKQLFDNNLFYIVIQDFIRITVKTLEGVVVTAIFVGFYFYLYKKKKPIDRMVIGFFKLIIRINNIFTLSYEYPTLNSECYCYNRTN